MKCLRLNLRADARRTPATPTLSPGPSRRRGPRCQPAAGARPHNLTKRERAMLALMVEGLNNTEIAERLVESPSTIKSHVSHILWRSQRLPGRWM